MDEATTVLHVDDEPSFAELTTTFLERENDCFAVETVTSADEGLERITERAPDCVVSDYNMPGMDGLKFLRAVRETHPDLPFILFTGKGSEEVASDAIAAGVTDYIQKGAGAERYTLLANRIENAVESRREAQRADRQEELMRLTEFAGNTGGFELDRERNTILLTAGTRRIIGHPDKFEISLEEAIELFHPDDREDILQTFDRAFETGEELHNRWRLQPDDGDERLLEIAVTPVVENGEVTKVRGSGNDITDRQERQRELRQLRQAIDNANVPITLADPSREDDPLVYVNDGFEEMTGYPAEEAVGRNCRFLQGEDTDPEKVAALRDAIDNEESISVELRNYRKDGTEFWNRLTVSPIYDDDGNLVRYLGTQEDITGRKERERELRAERRFIGQALDTLDDLFYVLDTDGTLQRWNCRVPELTGYTDRDLAETQATELFPEDERGTIADGIATALADGQSTVEADLCTADGEHLPCEFTGAQLTDENGTVTGLVGVGRDLTERRQRERRFQALVEESNDIVSVVDADGVIQYQSPSVERLLGYPPEGTIGDTAWEYVHPDDRADLVKGFERWVDEPGANPVVEYRARHADGSWCWLEARGNNQLDNPAVEGYVLNSRDIAARKQREREIERTRDLMTSMETLADIGAWEYDSETETLTLTDGARRLHGLDPGADLSLDESFESFHPDDRDLLGERFDTCLETGESQELEVRLTAPDGKQRWITARSERVTDGREDSVVRGYMQDTTDRIQRQQNIEQYRTIVAALADAVYMIDEEGQFTHVNDEFVELVGYEKETIIGNTPSLIKDDDAVERAEHQLGRLLSRDGPETVIFEVTIQPRTGEPVVCEDHMGVLPYDGEEFEGSVGVLRDITEHKEYEQGLEAQNERLEEFTSIVSHDLRSPLGVARGHLELAGTTEDNEHLAKATDAIERSQALIDDLLTLAREGDQVDETEPVAIAGLAESSWQTVETAQATLDVGEPGVVEADRSRLRELFENLHRNAVEHGGDEVTVSVGKLSDGFYVADTGPGIPEAEREAVFEAGYSTGADGTGFGLRIVGQIAESHGWETAVTESGQGGARFEFTGVETPE